MKRPFDHDKSAVTIAFDLARWLLILGATGYLLMSLWRWNWIVAIVAAIPILVVVMNIIGFASLPVYLLTPENRLKARMARAIESGDLERAKALTDEFAARFNVKIPEDAID